MLARIRRPVIWTSPAEVDVAEAALGMKIASRLVALFLDTIQERFGSFVMEA